MRAAFDFSRQDPSAPPVSSGAMTAQMLKILLMDDNAFDRRTIRRVADQSVFDIEWLEADSVGQTRALLTSQKPDLVMLDVCVPDGDGIDLARQITGDRTVPAIVISGEGDVGAAMRALCSGATDFLTKDRLSADLLDTSIRLALGNGAPGGRDGSRWDYTMLGSERVAGGVWTTQHHACAVTLSAASGWWDLLCSRRRPSGTE